MRQKTMALLLIILENYLHELACIVFVSIFFFSLFVCFFFFFTFFLQNNNNIIDIINDNKM